LRVYYSALTSNEICIADIQNIINSKYQRSNASAGPCLVLNSVSTGEPLSAINYYVQPNPFTESTTIYFENADLEAVTLTLTDLSGRVVRTFSDVRAEQISISRAALPAGTYIFHLASPKGKVSGKIVAF
jgi:hypothetical protein